MSAGPSSSSAHHNPPTVPDDDPALCLQRLTLDDPRRAAPSKPATRMPAAMPSAMDTTAGKRCTIVPHTTRLVPPSISILRGSSLPLPWPLSRIGSVPVARGPVRAADPAKNAKNPKRLSAYFAHVRWGTATEINQIPSHPHSSSSTHTNTKYAAPPTTQRPSLPSRTTSYSKRHASFDSPREVPLPSPATLMQQYFPAFPSAPRREHAKSVSQPQAFASVFRDEGDGSDSASGSSGSGSVSGSASGSPAPSELSLRHPKVPGSPRARHAPYPPPHLHPHPHHGDDLLRGDIKGKERERERAGEEAQAGQVFPFARPYSLPHSTASSSASSASTEVGAAVGGGGSTSTSSLPLPAQTPVRLLPPASPMHTDFPLPLPEPASSSSSSPSATTPASAQKEPPLHLRPQTQPPPPGPPHRTRDAAVPSSFTIPPLPTRRPPSPPPTSYPNPHPHASMSRSLSTTTTTDEYVSAPAPPTVLPGPARPAAPFLAPSPVEHAVRVETARGAYTLHISLPGFRRDAITLATRRRRVLHVVADDWAPGGGHFERRVSFGWDAELGAVRAEFDGSVLRVVVPRRVPGVAW
ncbi:hypothetical protein HWV62_20722 [Athelia sp. TMB]|nr:hypothetical protein HWV62_20722 [Athelia sp. TMB]